jgi:rSAM/selenodomain-associated transferase 1
MPTRANALAVMAKAPVPGAVKTRLAPPLTPEQAARFYRALLLDQLEHLTALGSADLYVAFTPDDAKPLVEALVPPGYRCFPQSGGDLGARMCQTMGELWRRGHRNVILIGSDLPPVPLETLQSGFAELARGERQIVLGPSRDGGYYLIGMNQPAPEIFSAMTWSHEGVLAATTEKLDRLDRRYHLLPEWFDIDTVDDIARIPMIHDPGVRAAMKRTLLCLRQLSRLVPRREPAL